MRTTQKILNGGKVTIPKVIREELGVGEGDVIEVEITQVSGDGE
jgi:AbrB family looped-hinge helix DNA binding protein